MIPRLLMAAVACAAMAGGAEPPGYYLSAEGRTGDSLRQALHGIIAGHRAVSYSATREALKALDEDPANPQNVLLVYSRKSRPKSAFVPAPDGWNREHLWPQSYGIDGAEPAYSDLFNLRAADESVNADRGNQYFDTSDPADRGYQGRGQVPEAPLCTQDSDSWEPPDVVKGDIARALFYMDVRYEGGRGGEPDLRLTDAVQGISSTTSLMGRLSALLVWHHLDPVDDAERRRAEMIFNGWQGNRNPFVDRPEWVREVYYDPLVLRMESGGGVRWRAELTPLQAQLEVSEDLRGWTTPEVAPSPREPGWQGIDPPGGLPAIFYRLRVR